VCVFARNPPARGWRGVGACILYRVPCRRRGKSRCALDLLMMRQRSKKRAVMPSRHGFSVPAVIHLLFKFVSISVRLVLFFFSSTCECRGRGSCAGASRNIVYGATPD
jgi:hypothetical protein